ncbi:MAG: hypothetical protein Q9226_009373 [Calogaya cf. arnoldii]
MDRYACSEAVSCMQAYYKVAMKVLVDNFSVLAVEKCILSDLAAILSPDIIINISDDEVNALAAESETSGLERRRATEELKTLQEGLKELNRFSRFRDAGDSTDDDEEEEEGAATPLGHSTPPSGESDHYKDTKNGTQSPVIAIAT